MKRQDWYLRVMVTLLVVGVWVLILKPVLAPTATEAATAKRIVRADEVHVKEIRAERLVVVDGRGLERARLEGSCLSLAGVSKDTKRSTRQAAFAVDADGAMLSLFSREGGGETAALTVKDGVEARLSLSSAQGNGARLRARRDGFTRLSLHGKDGNTRAWLSAEPQDITDLTLFDPGSRALAVVRNGGPSNPSVLLCDRNGKRRAELALNPAGEPTLTLSDQGRKPVFRAP